MLTSLFSRLRRRNVASEESSVVAEPVQGKDRFRYTAVTEPRFASPDGETIDCYVMFPEIDAAPLHYTAAKSDPGWNHSEEIYRRCLDGEFGPIAPFEQQ